jgi:hypothetical protein
MANIISWENFQGELIREINEDRCNLWKKDPDDETKTILRIVSEKSGVVQTVVDSNIVDELRKCNWYVCKLSKTLKKYIACSKNGKYLHQMIISLNNIEKPDEENSYSIDHINRDTLDNRLINLRWATQSSQNMNTDRRTRKNNARNLPDGISPKDIPKWVTYNKEVYNKNTGATREFFRIEKHPKINNWASSKSNKVSIQDKLAETYKKLEQSGDDPFEHPVLHFKYSGCEKPDYVKEYDKDPNILATDGNFVLKRDTIPKYVNFVKETEKRGSKFEIAIPETKRWCTTGSKKVTLENKYNEMISKYNTMQIQ